ncbi:MAG: DUF2231 domain-containing protein [Gammaproteobacteria bacterium]
MIPLHNLHPIFVHFTVALFTTSAIFFTLAYFTNEDKRNKEFLTVAHWSMWTCAFFTIGTVIAGLYAFYTVAHDTESHIAILTHRNLGIPTFILILLLAFWSWVQYRKNQQPTHTLLIFLFIGLFLLVLTGWHGSKLVYHYGVGVKALPVLDPHQH